jgi:hypothetical protein
VDNPCGKAHSVTCVKVDWEKISQDQERPGIWKGWRLQLEEDSRNRDWPYYL